MVVRSSGVILFSRKSDTTAAFQIGVVKKGTFLSKQSCRIVLQICLNICDAVCVCPAYCKPSMLHKRYRTIMQHAGYRRNCLLRTFAIPRAEGHWTKT